MMGRRTRRGWTCAPASSEGVAAVAEAAAEQKAPMCGWMERGRGALAVAKAAGARWGASPRHLLGEEGEEGLGGGVRARARVQLFTIPKVQGVMERRKRVQTPHKKTLEGGAAKSSIS